MIVHSNFRDATVCVMGLGYVGLTLAAVMADVGFRVIGVEIRDEVVALLKDGKPHFHEPGLEQMLRQSLAEGRLEIHKRIPDDCDASAYIITVGTPLSDAGRARLDMVEAVAREVATKSRAGSLVIMRSTVKYGTTRKLVQPILEAAGKDLKVAFCPERTLEGQALTELRQLPQIVGSDDLETAIRATQIFQFLTPTVVRVSSWETAEMVKLIDNVQRDVHFAFANEVAAICDTFGVSAAEIIAAGKLGYPRTNLPMPGPVGGPCLSKDPHILAEGLAEHGFEPGITLAARRINEKQPERVAADLKSMVSQLPGFPDKPVITMMGLAFKGRPETDDLRGTMAFPMRDALKVQFPGATLRGFDPVVAGEQVDANGWISCPSLEAGFDGSDLVVIMNNHPVFGRMAINELSRRLAAPAIVYDFWNQFKASDLRLSPGTHYVALGSHRTSTLAAA